MRYTDEELVDIQLRTTADLKDNAAVVLPLVRDLIDSRKDHGIAVENSNGWRKQAKDLKERNKEMRALLDSFHEILGRVLFQEIVALHTKRVRQIEDWPSYDPAFDDEKARL